MRKAVIWGGFAAAKIFRNADRPRANSDHARRPCFLMGTGRRRAAATPVLTESATAKASNAKRVESLSALVRCVSSRLKPLVFRLPNMVSMVHRWR